MSQKPKEGSGKFRTEFPGPDYLKYFYAREKAFDCLRDFGRNNNREWFHENNPQYEAAPKAEESISYGMPAYKLYGPLVYFAAYKNHIGFYPTSSGVREFKSHLSKYKTSKGAIQLPIDQPAPIGLITKIVKFRVKENLAKAAKKKKKKTQ